MLSGRAALEERDSRGDRDQDVESGHRNHYASTPSKQAFPLGAISPLHETSSVQARAHLTRQCRGHSPGQWGFKIDQVRCVCNAWGDAAGRGRSTGSVVTDEEVGALKFRLRGLNLPPK